MTQTCSLSVAGTSHLKFGDGAVDVCAQLHSRGTAEAGQAAWQHHFHPPQQRLPCGPAKQGDKEQGLRGRKASEH